MYLVVDRMQVVNHLQRDQKTLEFKGENCRNNKWKKRRERENAETTVGKNAEREGERDCKEELEQIVMRS